MKGTATGRPCRERREDFDAEVELVAASDAVTELFSDAAPEDRGVPPSEDSVSSDSYPVSAIVMPIASAPGAPRGDSWAPLRGASAGASAAGASAAGASADTARVVAHRLVDLFGARGPEVCAALEPQAPLIADTGLPAAAVRWCVREEWAASLEDVMERRLMLSFDERLTRQAVEEVARVLVQEGVLQQYGLEAEVDGFVRHLRDRYGKDVT